MNPNDLKILQERLLDPLWRINNLYYIINKEGRKVKFKLNWAQDELYKNMWYCNLILKARQLGISTFVCLLFLDRCLFNSNVAAGIIAHTKEDAEQMFKRIKFAYDSLPDAFKQVRIANTDKASELMFNNGSSLRVGTSMRSATLQYLHISEFGKICAKYPEKAREIITGTLNTISAGQYCFIESTAEGRTGYFYDMCKDAQNHQQSKKVLSKLDFKFFFFPWWKHIEYQIDPSGIFFSQDMHDYFNSLETDHKIRLHVNQKSWYAKKSLSQREDMMREYPSTPTESFFSSNEGLYYGRQMAKVRSENRIRSVFYDANVPVYVAMDLGLRDATSMWFFQLVNQEVRLIDFYENNTEPLPHYFKIVKDKPYHVAKWFVPHDADTKEYSTNLSRTDVAYKHGIIFTVLPKLDLIDGINAARNILDRCFFDELKCEKGYRHLEAYKKRWNAKQGCYSSSDPEHDDSSHAADAFRYLAQAVESLASSSFELDEYRKMKLKHGVGGYIENNSILGN